MSTSGSELQTRTANDKSTFFGFMKLGTVTRQDSSVKAQRLRLFVYASEELAAGSHLISA